MSDPDVPLPAFPAGTPIEVIRLCIEALAEVERQSRPRVRRWRPVVVQHTAPGEPVAPAPGVMWP